MQFVYYFIYAYLGAGFLYAMYILLFAGDPWYSFLTNMLLGPAYIVRESIRAITYKGRPTFPSIFKNKKVVVFDLDGTLAATHEYWMESFTKVGIEKELNLPSSHKKGAGIEEKWQNILKNENDTEPVEELVNELTILTKKYFLDFVPDDIEPMDGFWSLARELKEDRGVELVLASNTDRDVVDVMIKRLGVENVFDFVIGGNEVKNKKPDPEIYKAVAKHFKVKPKHMVVFEDSPVGAEASVKAGINTIVIWDTEKLREFYPDKVKLYVPDFTPFPGNLDKTYREMVEEGAELVQEYNIDF